MKKMNKKVMMIKKLKSDNFIDILNLKFKKLNEY